EQIKVKHNDLVQRFNTNIRNYTELVEENSSLKTKINDIKHEIGSQYKSTKKYLKKRTDDLKTDKDEYNDIVIKIQEKSTKGELKSLNKQEKRKERDKGMEL